jgi:hypothetical protein
VKNEKNWDPSVPRFPVAVVAQTGANRKARRAAAKGKKEKIPGSMAPHVKRLNQETGRVEYVAER